MALYWPQGRIALEVIPQPERRAPPEHGPGDLVIYVGEEQVDDEEFLDAVSELIRARILRFCGGQEEAPDEAPSPVDPKAGSGAPVPGGAQGSGDSLPGGDRAAEALQEILERNLGERGVAACEHGDSGLEGARFSLRDLDWMLTGCDWDAEGEKRLFESWSPPPMAPGPARPRARLTVKNCKKVVINA